MDINDLVPIAEYAKLIGRDPANVRQKCLRGTLPGAVKIGRDWLIPRDCPYTDSRIKTGKYVGWRKKSMTAKETL